MKNYFSKLLVITILVLISSCAVNDGLGKQNGGYRERLAEQYYAPLLRTDIFLPRVPQWANFHQEKQCTMNSEMTFLHLSHLRREFDLNFREALATQYLFNDEVDQFILERPNFTRDSLSIKEYEKILLSAVQKSKSNQNYIKFPEVKSMALIQLENWKSLDELKQFLTKEEFIHRVPVIFSLCQRQHQLEKIFQELGVVSMGMEWATVFSESLEEVSKPFYRFELKAILPETMMMKAGGKVFDAELIDGKGKTIDFRSQHLVSWILPKPSLEKISPKK